MNVLSLFDGMSCGQLALKRVDIKVDKYFASEIDKYTIKIAQKNFPNTIQLGDIRMVNGADLSKIDLIIGGSPCQGFSFAGKQLAFNDSRSTLFFEYVRLLQECKPKYFLLENVRMKREYLDVISEQLGVQPICINSALVSAQNRVRYYWTNIPDVTQPEDKGILLKDIIENKQDQMSSIDANYYKGGSLKNFLEKRRKQLPIFFGGAIRGRYSTNSGISQQLELNFKEKANSLTTVQKDSLYAQVGKDNNVTWRKLTPLECERLQTVPDDYTEGVSNTQRYRMLGNGWTVDVIAHIFNALLQYNEVEFV
jgi:DNA-cytosine methyltransferase